MIKAMRWLFPFAFLLLLAEFSFGQTILDSGQGLTPEEIPDSIISVIEVYYPNTKLTHANRIGETFFVTHQVDSLTMLWTTITIDHMYSRQEISFQDLPANLFDAYVQPVLDEITGEISSKTLFLISDHPSDEYYELHVIETTMYDDWSGTFSIITESAYCFSENGAFTDCPHND